MLLVSCGGGGGSSSAERTFELTVTGGEADFAFVYPEDADTRVVEAVNNLAKFFGEKLGVDKVPVYDDTREENDGMNELLFGLTDREESQTALDNVKHNGFVIDVYSNGKLSVLGNDTAQTVSAVNYIYMHYDELFIDNAMSSKRAVTANLEYKYDDILVGNTSITEYGVVYPDPGGTYAEKDSVEKFAAYRLSEQIGELCGETPAVYNEKDAQDCKYRLILEPSDGSDSYGIRTEGKDIVICADSYYSYTKAFDALLSSDNIPSDLSAEGKDLLKESGQENFVYVSYLEDKVHGDAPVKSLKIGDTDISEYRIIYHDYGKSYSGYGMNEIYAAEQLQRYLKYATGIELPLDTDSSEATEHEILVGNTDRTEEDLSGYGIEEYIIKAEGTRLVIAGGEQRGTLYGVYSFLEDQVGCRFFAEDCEVIYKAQEIVIPADINVRYAPVLEYRDTDDKIYQGGEVAAKRKINSSFCRAMTYYQGSSVDFAGSAFVHTMDTVYKLGSQSTQPCFSSEENYQTVLEKSRRILGANPNAEIISVTQNDNNNYCTCKDCSAVYLEENSHAAPLIRFVNRLAEELCDEYPNVKIETLAYMFSTEAPTITKPHENVIIELCSLDMCCNHALSDLSCAENQRFREQIEDWSAITDNLYIWYYAIEFTENAKDAPFMNFEALYDTYDLFMQNNVKGIFNQACVNKESEEFGALRAYLLSKLMWDPDMTRYELETARQEFIAAYYGEASDLIDEYYRIMHTVSRNRHFTQYAALAGVLDINRFNVLSDEISRWMDAAGGFEYGLDYTKNHVNLLRKGFSRFSKITDNYK